MVVVPPLPPGRRRVLSDEDQDKALFLGRAELPASYLVVDVRQGQALGSKLFAWDGKHFALQPFNDLHTELSMNAVSLPDILVRVAKLPGSTLESTGSTLREVIGKPLQQPPAVACTPVSREEQPARRNTSCFTAEEELIGADEPLPEQAKIEVLLATSGGIDLDTLSNEEYAALTCATSPCRASAAKAS